MNFQFEVEAMTRVEVMVCLDVEQLLMLMLGEIDIERRACSTFKDFCKDLCKDLCAIFCIMICFIESH